MEHVSGETLAELGEAEILDRIFPRLPHSNYAILGPGDDCAVISAPDSRYVVTTDMMVEGPDFRTDWSTAFEIGYKAAAINLADVAAMGAEPTALVVALGAPDDTDVAVLEQIADGLRVACGEMAPGCGVVGGDLSHAPVLVLSITAHGDLGGAEPVTRSGARVGDVVAVSGSLGLAGLGLDLLSEYGEAARGQWPTAVTAQLAPNPPIHAARSLISAQAHAAMDVSDGLARDASRMARASGQRIDLSSELLSRWVSLLRDEVSQSVRSDEELMALVLFSGESHALLASFSPDQRLPEGFFPVGRVFSTDSAAIGGGFLTRDGEKIDPAGWHPFRR